MQFSNIPGSTDISKSRSSDNGAARKLRFGTFEVDLGERELRNRGIRVHLQKKPFQILELLLQRPGALVTRAELAHHLWPNLHVSFGRGLNTAINVLRQALGDSSANCRYIETRPGLGYRFLAPVEEVFPPGPAAASDSTTDSVAVLPLDNATGDPAMTAVANRIAENLIASLSALEQIRVIAHTAARHYRMPESDPRTVGSELNVRAVLTGRLERSGDLLALSTELVDAKTGRRLWGEKYESTPDGIFEVESAIASALIKRLTPAPDSGAESAARRRYTSKLEAYADYQKGKYLQNKLTEADLGKSIAHFESALAQDASYALAYAGLSDTHTLFAFLGMLSPAAARSRAEELAQTALRMDDQLPEAHASLADIRKSFDWDYAAAEKQYRRALQLSPASADGHRAYASFLSAMGRAAEALEEIGSARQLAPLSLAISVESAKIHYMARRFEECARQAWEALVLEPEFARAQYLLGLAYEQLEMHEEASTELQNAQICSRDEPPTLAALGHAYSKVGKPEQARAMLAMLDNLSRRRYVSSYWHALVYAGLGENELAFESLDRAAERRDVWLIWLKVEPRFDPLRSDRRFSRLLETVGFHAPRTADAYTLIAAN